MAQPTVTRTFRARIYGYVYNIQELYHGNQEFSYYNVDTEKEIPFNNFWELEPEIMPEEFVDDEFVGAGEYESAGKWLEMAHTEQE